MERYQGEPLWFKINIKEDDGTYITDFANLVIEALFHTDTTSIRKGWSTKDQSISIGTETIGGVTRAYASFGLSGADTAEMPAGIYDYAMSVGHTEDCKAIGEVGGILVIKPSIIKDGVAKN